MTVVYFGMMTVVFLICHITLLAVLTFLPKTVNQDPVMQDLLTAYGMDINNWKPIAGRVRSSSREASPASSVSSSLLSPGTRPDSATDAMKATPALGVCEPGDPQSLVTLALRKKNLLEAFLILY